MNGLSDHDRGRPIEIDQFVDVAITVDCTTMLVGDRPQRVTRLSDVLCRGATELRNLRSD